MLHMVTCPAAKPYWKACAKFCKDILKYEIHPKGLHYAVVFNTAGSTDVMLPKEVCALLRHAVGRYYAAVTKVHKEGATFRWQSTFHWTLLKFQDAVLRWAYAIKLQFAQRAYSDLTQSVDDETLAQFPSLVTFEEDRHHFAITSNFKRAIKAAEDAASTRSDNNPGAALPPPAGGGAAGAP